MFTSKQIKKLAEECSIAEFEKDIFEASVEDLAEFARKVVDKYEEVGDNIFTSYGKPEDWE